MPRMMDLSSHATPGPGGDAVAAAVAQACLDVERSVAATLASDLPPVNTLCRHLEQYHGKMVRPVLVVLSGLATAPTTEKVAGGLVTLAAVCEMVHLATLVHDDVLDEADVRRKTQTVNRLAGNEAAVILGDYVLSAAFALCSTLGDARISEAIGRTGMTLCAGELVQLHHRENLSLDERTYFELVRRKTSSLIAVSASLGCRLAGGPDALQARFGAFAEKLGTAFQIQDDLLDIAGDQGVVGKSLGKDMEKGKLTLPVIHHLATATPAARGRTLTLLGAPEHTPRQGERAELIESLGSTGSIDHARRTAESLVQEAKRDLDPVPESAAKRMLLSMADAVVSRAY
ncbi:MAG TPA: polyprenyl synthetase family protein [Phycisphaerales bacterium]|nr:polyprenyl synthetase family protein [Phycisphaerales bacterium]